jgi:hypothetical protein
MAKKEKKTRKKGKNVRKGRKHESLRVSKYYEGPVFGYRDTRKGSTAVNAVTRAWEGKVPRQKQDMRSRRKRPEERKKKPKTDLTY